MRWGSKLASGHYKMSEFQYRHNYLASPNPQITFSTKNETKYRETLQIFSEARFLLQFLGLGSGKKVL
jgi:hypothetical protein